MVSVRAGVWAMKSRWGTRIGRQVVSLCIGVLTLFAPGVARAAGVYGPSGLFLHTTAYVPASGGPTFGATVFTQVRRTPAGDRSVTWVPVFVDTRLGNRAEAGLVYLYQRFAGEDLSSYGGFAKYQILPEGARACPADQALSQMIMEAKCTKAK